MGHIYVHGVRVCEVLSIWHKVQQLTFSSIPCCWYGVIICSDVGMDVVGLCLYLSQFACNTAVAEHIYIGE